MDTEVNVVGRSIHLVADFEDKIVASPFKVWVSKHRRSSTNPLGDTRFQVGLRMTRVWGRYNDNPVAKLSSSLVEVPLTIVLDVESSNSNDHSIILGSFVVVDKCH